MFNLKFFSILLFFWRNTLQTIQWKENWAFGCDFLNHDLDKVQIIGENCWEACYSKPQCTHFSWNIANGGTCWMKYGNVSKSDAFEKTDLGNICGVTRESITISLEDMALNNLHFTDHHYFKLDPYRQENCTGLYLTEYTEGYTNRLVCNIKDRTNALRPCDAFCGDVVINRTREYFNIVKSAHNETNQFCSCMNCGDSFSWFSMRPTDVLPNLPTYCSNSSALKILFEEFVVAFYVYAYDVGVQNILYLKELNCEEYFLEVYASEKKLTIALDKKIIDINQTLNTGKWNFIEIKQESINGDFVMTIVFNEVLAYNGFKNDLKEYFNVVVVIYNNTNLYIASKNQVPWSVWSSCNVSYGNGFMNRSRECCSENCTRCCSDNSFDFQNCYAFWSQWSNWSSCNISYGIGFMNRTRECDASHSMECPGNTTELMNCCFNKTFQGNLSEVMNCCLNETFQVSWMQWSNWSSCNVFYGNGFMNRSRECNVDNSTMCCSDNSLDFQSCYGFWSQWSNWSHCNISYGIGFMNRIRECNVSSTTMWCPGNSTELMNCCLKRNFNDIFDVKNCCLNETIIVTWSQWSLWSTCNTSYSNGFMDRSRKCNFDIPVCCFGESFRFQTCSEWSTWSECSATCGNGYRTQSSTYKKRVTNTESCNLRNCPVDGVWGAWKKSNCSSTCGARNLTFSRDCDPPPSDNGRNCMGISNYTQDCDNEIICPENGVWSEWTFWSLCNQPCEGGEMSRFHTCFPPKYGGQYCDGSDSENTECQPKSCKIVVLNLLIYFPDVQYTSDYSELGNKIEQAIAKLYKKSFRIEFHSFIDGNSDFFDSVV